MSTTYSQPTMLSHARKCAKRGWQVFPVFIQATAKGKSITPLGARWMTTTDPRDIDKWERAASQINGYGIDCGASGLLVVDVDPGAEWPFGAERVHTTGRGTHHLYRAPHDLEIANTVRLQPWGVDIRAAGGMVIGPGSWHPRGAYSVAVNGKPGDPPPELLTALEAAASKRHTLEASAYDGPAYMDMSPGQQYATQSAQAGAMSDWHVLLETAADWPEGETDDQGRGWEALARDFAFDLARYVTSDAWPLDAERAEEYYRMTLNTCLPSAPELADKYADLSAKAWRKALAPLPPPAPPEEDFEPLPPETSEEEQRRHDKAVARRAFEMRVDYDARRVHLADVAPAPEWDVIMSGDPDPENTEPLVESLVMPYGRLAIIAKSGAGKSQLAVNLAHSLTTGEDFLGLYRVNQDYYHDGEPFNVAFLNHEMTRGELKRWVDRRGIPTGKVAQYNISGALPLYTPHARGTLTKDLRERNIKFVIVDPFTTASGVLDENSNSDVRPWLDELHSWVTGDVGALGVALVVHQGHGDDKRARGSSALQDWADMSWHVGKINGDIRKFSLTKSRLNGKLFSFQIEFDGETGAMTAPQELPREVLRQMQSANAAEEEIQAHAALVEALRDIITHHYATEGEPLTVARVDSMSKYLRSRGHAGATKIDIQTARKALVEGELITESPGPRNSTLLYPAKHAPEWEPVEEALHALIAEQLEAAGEVTYADITTMLPDLKHKSGPGVTRARLIEARDGLISRGRLSMHRNADATCRVTIPQPA